MAASAFLRPKPRHGLSLTTSQTAAIKLNKSGIANKSALHKITGLLDGFMSVASAMVIGCGALALTVTPGAKCVIPINLPCQTAYQSLIVDQDEFKSELKTGDCAFHDMQAALNALGQPDCSILANSLKRCRSLSHVKGIHRDILIADLGQELFLGNVLVSAYAKYGAWQESRAIFYDMPIRSVITWTTIINGLARCGQVEEAFLLYRSMQEEAVTPNNVTFISLLGACAGREHLIDGERLHASVGKDWLHDVVLGTALISMHGRCGNVKDAREIFDKLPNENLVSWNAMITIYVDHEQGKEALRLFQKMQSVGVDANDCTYINSLKACVLLEDIQEGRAIHSCLVECELLSDVVVCNALLNMYGKCGAVDDAMCIFLNLQEHDLVSWNGMITAYAQQSLGTEALELFRNMQQQGMKPDNVTFVNVVSACATLSAFEEGKCMHSCLLNDGFESDVQIMNALIHMYGRCGVLGSALTVFGRVGPQNVVSWTAIIAAFSQQGQAKAALELFKQMQRSGVKPDKVTYVMILSACSHAGLVEEGRSCFVSMETYGLTPNVEHYVCMADLFGRAGLLSEAEEFIHKMPSYCHDGRPWSALLGSCTIHSDASRAKYAAEEMISFGPQQTSPYVLLANLYASITHEGGQDKIRVMMDELGKILEDENMIIS